MGFTDIFHRNRTQPYQGVSSSFGLTTTGKQRAESLSVSGVKGTVMYCLNDNGTSSISDITEETRIPYEKVKAILRVLMREGYVRNIAIEE